MIVSPITEVHNQAYFLVPPGHVTANARKARTNIHHVGWLINVDLAIFQPYLDLEAGDNQSLKIQVARPGIEPRSSCSASQELNHTAAPNIHHVPP